jgi:indole-3-glycerol phosphate synthase
MTFFQGDIRFLEEIAQIKKQPLLRKDFVIDEFQILEARSAGADAVLLISEILEQGQIRDLTKLCTQNNMEVLLELHSVSQVDKIDFDINKLIGINNRNLEDFSVSLSTSLTIAEILPDDITIVSESGIHEQNDIEVLKQSRINAVLVGEHLMRSDNPGEALKLLKDWCENAG